MPAPTHAGAEDDVKITALKLPPGTLSAEMDAYFKKCDEKLGFVPNVLKAFAFDDGLARLATTPAPVGSDTWTNMIGVVRVSFCNALVPAVVFANITSGLK